MYGPYAYALLMIDQPIKYYETLYVFDILRIIRRRKYVLPFASGEQALIIQVCFYQVLNPTTVTHIPSFFTAIDLGRL